MDVEGELISQEVLIEEEIILNGDEDVQEIIEEKPEEDEVVEIYENTNDSILEDNVEDVLEDPLQDVEPEENCDDSNAELCENSQDVSLISQDSHDGLNDSNLMETSNAMSAAEGEGDDTEQSARRKYKRKVYDLNVTRKKLHRRAKDLKLEEDTDFVQVPPPAQPSRGRGRGRGRKKLETSMVEGSSLSMDGILSPITPTRGRGRGRGSRGGGRTPRMKTPRGAARPRPPKFQVLEEDTRMSIENSFSSSGPGQSHSQSESPWTSIGTPKKKVGMREVFDPSSHISANQLVEYPWPNEDTNADLWMVQEQVVSFLNMKGNFKRKYPDLRRRQVDVLERTWLRERNAVSEMQANLGLTALLSREVLDLFFNDFPEKYEEYLKAQTEKKELAYKTKSKPSTPGAPTEKKPFDPRLRAIKAAAKWNALFNKERVDERVHCLDLQTFTVQVPRRPIKLIKPTSTDPYPVAVIPGQFSSFFKSYSPYQLNCMPLGTVMRGPMVGQPDLSQRRKRRPTTASSVRPDSATGSDSDNSSSSSDDSSSDSSDEDSSSSSEAESDEERPAYTGQPGVCKLCRGDRRRNKEGHPEPLVHCAKCQADGHLTCWDLDVGMASQIIGYSWECNDCKTCIQCHDPADEEKMLFCDYCDRGYHTYCVGLRSIPEGRWHCPVCAMCGSCGTRDPSGDKKWIHEYKVNRDGAKIYAVTLCGVCVKYWRQGNYCVLCNRCFASADEAGALVVCRNCPKRAYEECQARTKQREFLCVSCTEKSQNRMKRK